MLATCWPRARWSPWGASTGPASLRASAISSAVRTAVPLGESIFVFGCVSTISIDEKNGAAAAASALPITEPSEKFGINTAGEPDAATSGRTSAMRSADQPEVPTRMGMPRSTAARTTSTLDAGVDTSTTRSAPSSSLSALREPRSACSSYPGSAAITARTIVPSFPEAPTMATRVVMPPVYARWLSSLYGRISPVFTRRRRCA